MEKFLEYSGSAKQREVESVLGKQSMLERNVKMFLCKRNTGDKLKDIAIHFGTEESAVSHASGRITRE